MHNIAGSQKNLILWVKKVFICALSIVILGISLAFNAKAMLGNDPISVFYDGLGIVTNTNMGIASNIINFILIITVILIDRKYIHIGTIIYVITLGVSINLGFYIYNTLNIPGDIISRSLCATGGYMLSFCALGSFMAINIGIDPWTAMALILSKKINKPFGPTKAFVDTFIFIIGMFLGGKVGIMTLISALAGGPIIQKISEFLDRVFPKMLNYKG